jgi:hypothetical protein
MTLRKVLGIVLIVFGFILAYGAVGRSDMDDYYVVHGLKTAEEAASTGQLFTMILIGVAMFWGGTRLVRN